MGTRVIDVDSDPSFQFLSTFKASWWTLEGRLGWLAPPTIEDGVTILFGAREYVPLFVFSKNTELVCYLRYAPWVTILLYSAIATSPDDATTFCFGLLAYGNILGGRKLVMRYASAPIMQNRIRLPPLAYLRELVSFLDVHSSASLICPGTDRMTTCIVRLISYVAPTVSNITPITSESEFYAWICQTCPVATPSISPDPHAAAYKTLCGRLVAMVGLEIVTASLLDQRNYMDILLPYVLTPENLLWKPKSEEIISFKVHQARPEDPHRDAPPSAKAGRIDVTVRKGITLDGIEECDEDEETDEMQAKW
jgi:hypothetical protein